MRRDFKFLRSKAGVPGACPEWIPRSANQSGKTVSGLLPYPESRGLVPRFAPDPEPETH
jgi:hypothetical protein